MADKAPLFFQSRLGGLRTNYPRARNQRPSGCVNTAPGLTITSDRSALMAASQLPSPDVLRQLLRYDPKTGLFLWKTRSKEFFNQPKGGSGKSIEWNAAKWNTRYVGRPALIKRHGNGYLCGSIFNRAALAHRVAWAIFYGEWPQNSIDHINGNKTDNRIANLRNVPHAGNMRNTKLHKTSSTGVVGVHWAKHMNKWSAEITYDGTKRHLGLFLEFDDAVNARRTAQEHFGFHPNHGRSV